MPASKVSRTWYSCSARRLLARGRTAFLSLVDMRGSVSRRRAVRSPLHEEETMRKTLHGASILALALALGAAAADTPRTRDFDFTYKARVTELPADARQVDLWIPVPVSDDLQEVTVTGISAPVPYVITKDGRYGNSVLHFAVTAPQQPEIAVEMNVRVRRKESLHHDLPTGLPNRPTRAALPADAAQWVKPDRLVPLDDRIKSL